MGINFNVSSDSIDEGASYVVKAGKIAKTLGKLGKRNSIMKMAEPGMYQYPLLTSGSIEMQVNTAIAKAFQLTYASAVVTAYSLNPVMYLKDYEEPSDFVRKFHTNTSSSYYNLTAAQRSLGVKESSTTLDIEDADVTSATVNMDGYSKEALEAMSIQAWDDTSNRLDNSSLNDMYRPYDRTERIMKEKISGLKKANEATFDDIYSVVDDIDSVIDPDASKNNWAFRDKNNNDKLITRNFNNAVVRNDKLEAMEPTMVNVEIICHSKKQGQFNQRLTLGVKVMPRLLQSDMMIASMVEACKDSNGIFKFLKLTKGEQKTLDFVLGISASKKRALEKNAKVEIRLLKQAKKRKSSNLFRKALKNE